MPEDIVQLSRRIARLKPNADACWFDDHEKVSGLPMFLQPFYIQEQFDRGSLDRTGIWDVWVGTKGGADAKVFADITGAFAAARANGSRLAKRLSTRLTA